MKIIHSIILLGALAIFSLHSNAQTVSVNFDNKVIYADSLNMPESTIAEYIISILPELLERPGDFSLNDYEVKIEDMPVGDAVDGVLTQIRLSDIERIEINDSPLSSFQNDSKSGSINIFLKNRDTKQKHYWGNVSVDYTAPTNVSPAALFGYRKDNFMIRAFMISEYYKSSYDTDCADYDYSGEQQSWFTRTSKDKFWTNMASVFVNYNATPKDELLFRSSVHNSHEKENNDNKQLGGFYNIKNKYTDLRAYFKYTHHFGGNNQLEFESQYVHHPQNYDINKTEGLITKEMKSNDISGQLKVMLSLLPSDSKYKSLLSIGSNANASLGNSTDDHAVLSAEGHLSVDKTNSKGVTPFFESENTFGQFRLKLMANYQYYHYDFRREGNERMHKDNNDLAGKVMAEWHFREGQILRLIGDHQIYRPSEIMIYPHLIEDTDTRMHLMGNIDLKNMISNSLTLDYFYSNRWGESSLTMNTSGSINHISNIIRSEYIVNDKGMDYITFENAGNYDMFVGMFMAMYKYKLLSLTFTADYYNNFKKLDSDDDHYHYFCISLLPSFKTKSNWMGSMRIKYFTPIHTKDIYYGSCAGISFQFGKSWNNFNVHAFGNISVLGRTKDIYYYDDYYSEEISKVMKNEVGIGVRYSF